MDNQRHDSSEKSSLSAANRKSDAFWGMIMPSACLGKERPSHTTGALSAYSLTNHVEELKGRQPVSREEKARQKPRVRQQPALSDLSVAEQLKRIQSKECEKRAGNRRPPVGNGMVSNSLLQRISSDEESFEESEDTEGSNGDGEYVEVDNETDSNASSFITQRSHSSHRTSPRGMPVARGSLRKLWAPSRTTAPKRKTNPSNSASASGKKPRKKTKFSVGESEEDVAEEEEEVLSVPYNANRPTRNRIRRQRSSTSTTVAPLSRRNKEWTSEEEERLYDLRKQGKDWEYIRKRMVGRTLAGVKGHFDAMRTESLKPTKMRITGRRRRQNGLVLSAMAKIPSRKNKPWSKKEDAMMISLRAKGKTIEYVTRRLGGRGYNACKQHWRKIQSMYPKASWASELPGMDGKRVTTGSPDTHFSTVSQLDQKAEDASLDSRSATIECDGPESSADDDSSVDAGIDSLPIRRQYGEAVVVHTKFASIVDSKRANWKATSTNHHDQQAVNCITSGETSSQSPKGSAHSNQPDMESVIAKIDSKTHNEPFFRYGLLLPAPPGREYLRNETGAREWGTPRRSNSWPR